MCQEFSKPSATGTSTPFADATLPYQPRNPKNFRPGIGLIGCGGITRHHLAAYQKAGFSVLGFCDLDRQRAIERRDQYFPGATVYDSYDKLLANDQIAVVDIATHPDARVPVIEAALRAGKHVLSQKPFVTDLEVGDRLAQLADEQGVLLAVNQNARWAPHFSYVREAVAAAWIGPVVSMHCGGHWDHSWVKGGPFENVPHLILFDYAIHWFDMLTAIMGEQQPLRVFASVAHSPEQDVKPPLLGQVLVEYPNAQASLVFDACNNVGSWDTMFVLGTRGSIRSEGIDANHQQVILSTEHGQWHPTLEGQWFDDGFHGAMGELLRAIEEHRTPENNARGNLRSLALCFAAIHSAETHQPVVPGSVTKLPK